jgi:hypothetical protein
MRKRRTSRWQLLITALHNWQLPQANSLPPCKAAAHSARKPSTLRCTLDRPLTGDR